MSDQPRKFRESPGSLRPSQLTTTFGPGSIAQLEHDSVLVMGLDYWGDFEKFSKVLHHPYLELVQKVDKFLMPISVEKMQTIPCKSFPKWGVCSKCSNLQRHKDAPADGKRFFKCDNCGGELYPARFAITCDKGHLDEFPWVEWAHSEGEEGQRCNNPNPKMKFYAKGFSAGLGDYVVHCDECGLERSCSGATSYQGLTGIVDACNGSRPWLGNTTEKCETDQHVPSPVYGVQIRSSSLYYPSTISALYIPEWLHPVQIKISENKDQLKGMLDMNTPDEIAEKATLFSTLKQPEGKYSVDEIKNHIEKRFSGDNLLGRNPTELQIRDKEFFNLKDSDTADFDGGDLLDINDVPLDDFLEPYVENLKQIKRITEIRVIRGFTRGNAPDPYSQEEDKEIHFCEISKRKTDWLPAVENKGEGILFSLNEDKLREWENKPEIIRRCKPTIQAYHSWAENRNWKKHEELMPRYLLLHTLSHVLIRELAHLSGYNESSIRERIYRGEKYNGILLYTASPASDGSLGGLVRQGETRKFGKILLSAINKSKYCSRDPLCAEDNPIEKIEAPLHTRLNGSACYGCALLPETSCENINRLLDRQLLFNEEYGFFSDMK